MAAGDGRFVWYELMTTDTAAAKAFYTEVVGWGMQPGPVAGMDYTLLTAGSVPMAGLMALPEEARAAGAPPHWIGYVGTADVDASATQARDLGGSIIVPPTDIPDIGRFAVIADPQGAAIALFKGTGAMEWEPPARGTPATFSWHELYATDWSKAFDFYQAMFGWEKSDAMQTPDMGTYQIFSIGGVPSGGMCNKPAAMPRAAWLYYAEVEALDAAVAKVTEGGGSIVLEPMQVPGGGWIVQGRDPQGAAFALHAPKR